MKVLFLECNMGAAGDMLGAALLGIVDDKKRILEELNSIGLKGIVYKLEDMEKCGIKSNHLRVLIYGKEEGVEDAYEHGEDCHGTHGKEAESMHEHHHHTLYEIEDIIESTSLSKEIKSDVREVYELLAEAESDAHGVAVDQIHFHEVGNMDAIADIVATCYIMHEINPDKIIVSPINYGGGSVKTAHGILPVPAPATAYLLREIPSYGSNTIKAELCTPTGAALIKYFADEFSQQPSMIVHKIGYGAGKKDFPQANILRTMLGEMTEANEQVCEFACNIDDMTAEEIGFATERLYEAGALEVYTISADMKKNRPGVVLHCLCKLSEKDNIIHQIFKNTTTIGIREYTCNRYVLNREIEKVDTPYGQIRKKTSYGYNISRSKFEYDDLAGIAIRTGKSIIDLKRELEEK